VLTSGSALTFNGSALAVTGATSPQFIATESGGLLYAAVQLQAVSAGGKHWTIASNATSSPLGTGGGLSFRDSSVGTTYLNLTASGLEVTQSQLIGYSSYAGIGTNGLAVAGNVGIGTSSPAYKLDVTGTGLVSSFGSNTVAETYIQVKNGTSTLYLGGASAYNYVYSTASIPLTFWTNSQEAGRFSSDGTFRVKGAGTAGSTDAFQVSGSAPASAMTLNASGNLNLTNNLTVTGAVTGASFNSITGLSATVGTTLGTAAVGTSTTVARSDHVHPLQTTISGNAGTATAWQTARTLTIGNTGKSVDGSAAVSWSLAEIGAYASTNPAGYTTNVGTVTSVGGTGTVSGLTLTGSVTTTGNLTLGGTLSASIDNLTDEHRIFNNMGDIHGTRTAFDASTPSYNFGWRFIQGSTNGPNVNSATQYYSLYLGLGNDYAATGSGSYGMQLAIPRNVTAPYLTIRYNENNSLAAWQKISAGYADSSGQVNFSGTQQLLPNAWAGGGGYPGYQFTGGNSRFGFSSTSGVVDVYADGNFYATDSSHLVLHAGNYNSYSPTLTGGNASGTWGINVTGSAGSVSTSTSTGVSSSFSTTINTTTPGTGTYGINFVGHGTPDNASGITWSWSGSTAQAGIYVQSSGSYGTKMYIATTDSFAAGAKTAVSIDHVGNVSVTRGSLSVLNAITQNGNQVLHASNYNSYSPTLTGGGASGTWGINITGNAANITAYTINQSVGTSNAPTFADVYTNGWFRNNESGEGLYNQATGNHWYSDSANYWNMGGGVNGSGIRFRDNHAGTVRGYVYYDQSNNIGFLNQDGSWRARVVGGDYWLVDGSSARAQLFYDSNDTAYYVDAASTTGSRLSHLYVGNVAGSNDGGWNARLKVIGSSHARLDVVSNSDGIVTSMYSHTGQGVGRLGTTSNHPLILIAENGNDGGSVYNGSLRSPIFYDSNNTGYYVDPASTSNLNYSVVRNLISGDGYRFTNPQGGSYVTSASSATGAIRIRLPANRRLANTMLQLKVKVYEYTTGCTHEFIISGYNYTYWVNVAATQTTDAGRGAFNVRWGDDGTYQCIWIGETGTVWSYPQVHITEVQLGYSGYSNEWGNGWSVDFVTSFNTVDTSRTASMVKTVNNAANWAYPDYATIFYDSNDTGYYFDGASTSYANDFRANIFYQRDDTNSYWDNNTFVLRGTSPTVTLRDTDHNTASLHCNSNIFYVLRGATDTTRDQWSTVGSGWWPLEINLTNNNATFGGDVTAAYSFYGQVFYDRNDTGYYWDGASTSRWNESNQNGWHTFNNYGLGVTGTYDSTRLQTVFAMGSSYRMTADGTSTSNMYGIAWSHPNAGSLGGASNLNDHGLLIINNGGFRAALSSRAVFSADVRGTLFYDYNDTAYSLDPASTSVLWRPSAATQQRWSISWRAMDASASRPQQTGDSDYWTTTVGWATTFGTWANYWKYGFGGFDCWGTSTDHPQGAGYVHAQGIQSGLHYANSDGSSAYGWQMVGAHAATDNRYWARGKWGGSISGWKEFAMYGGGGAGDLRASLFYDSDNTGYYTDPASTSNLNVLALQRAYAGYDAGVTGSFSCSDWFRSSGNTGWYNASYAGGINMEDTTWVRVYNSKAFYVNNQIAATGDVTSLYSDSRLKTNLGTIKGALQSVLKLSGFRYVNNELAKSFGYTSEKLQLGVSAQEVEALFPEIVSLAPFDMHTDAETGEITSKSGDNYKTVAYDKLVPVLIEAIKEQDDKISRLEALVEKLLENKT
jgi:hypothetical protein